MRRGQIIYAVVLITVLGVFAAVYQFYFKAKLEVYSRDKQFMQDLEAAFQGMETFFHQTDPETLTRLWRNEVQPWSDALQQRSRYFDFGGWYDHEFPPKDGPMIRFWYDETSRKMVFDLWQKVGERLGNYNLFPQDVFGMFNVPSVDTLPPGQALSEREVNQHLARLAYGINVSTLLLDAKASSINNIVMWPPRKPQKAGHLLNLQTFGASYTMTMRDFISFMEKLRLSERYFNVDAFRVYYPYVCYQTDPIMQVEMLVTNAGFIRRAQTPDGAPAADAASAAPAGPRGARDLFNQEVGGQPLLRSGRRELEKPQPEPGAFGKAWKWFKQNILVMH